MYLPTKDACNKIVTNGLKGLPEHYPIPSEVDNLLFYIQRNQNPNTVIYQSNIDSSNTICSCNPINVFWKQYDNDGCDKPLNFIQEQLAYGYSKEIFEDTIMVSIVSYPDYKIYINKNESDKYVATAKIDNQWAELTNVYVFADEGGAFPVVKYIELYGNQKNNGLPCFEKIVLR